MENIRNKVFETNSSSVHSIVIDKSGREKSRLKPNKDGAIVAHFGKFGKELEYYNTQSEKLSYLVSLLYYYSGDYDMESIYNLYEFGLLKEAVCKYTGANDLIIAPGEPEIDHQSQPWNGEDTLVNFYDEDQIIDFMFNKYITLKTACD